MKKPVKITLEYHGQSGDLSTTLYKVRSITNSTDYVPGEFLKREKVDLLCSSREFEVNIVAGPKDLNA